MHYHFSECDVSVSKLPGFRTFPFLDWFRIQYRTFLVSNKYRIRYRKNLVSDSVSKNCQQKSFRFGCVQILGILGGVLVSIFFVFYSFGFSIDTIWYKKYWIRYLKILVSKKVLDLVSEKFGIGKSFGFCFVHILGIVTHWHLQYLPL